MPGVVPADPLFDVPGVAALAETESKVMRWA